MKQTFKVASLKSVGKSVNVIFTKEVEDRDGETVMVDGIDLTNFAKNPVVLNTHKNDDILDILGTAENLRKEVDANGKKMLTGDIKFADHPKAKFAEQMVRRGELNTVSIGFRVVKGGFDPSTNTITNSELFELSFVPVPANPEALVRSKQAKFHELTNAIDTMSDAEDVYKRLANYEDIHPKMKEVRKMFLSEEFCGMIEYEKTGDELVDYKTIYDLIVTKLASEEEADEEPETKPEETPKEEDSKEEETPREESDPGDEPVTMEEVREVISILYDGLN
jgi:HK97 family phage prohead protease